MADSDSFFGRFNLVVLLVLALFCSGSLAGLDLCDYHRPVFLDHLNLQCPHWVEISLPTQIHGSILDKVLNRTSGNSFCSVLFYASWCPFSRNIQPTFNALSTMFPQIRHIAVEESSALPIVFSRYGIHGFPSILIGNRTMKLWYHDSKDLSSLVKFYKEMTGFEPVADVVVDGSDSKNIGSSQPFLSPMELVTREPYLVFSIFFIYLRIIMWILPSLYFRIKALWVKYTWRRNLVFLGETHQLIERALHVVDVKRLLSKLKLCNKNRSFHMGAKSAREWASSLTSVSLGEASS